jgi:hypothetical protein
MTRHLETGTLWIDLASGINFSEVSNLVSFRSNQLNFNNPHTPPCSLSHVEWPPILKLVFRAKMIGRQHFRVCFERFDWNPLTRLAAKD